MKINDVFREMVARQAGVVLTVPELPQVYGACIEALRTEGLQACDTFLQNFTDSYKIIAF